METWLHVEMKAKSMLTFFNNMIIRPNLFVFFAAPRTQKPATTCSTWCLSALASPTARCGSATPPSLITPLTKCFAGASWSGKYKNICWLTRSPRAIISSLLTAVQVRNMQRGLGFHVWQRGHTLSQGFFFNVFAKTQLRKKLNFSPLRKNSKPFL